MKQRSILNAERQAARVLENFLREIPRFDIDRIDREGASGSDAKYDFVVEGTYAGHPVRLAVEVKSNGQPRVMRNAAHQLRRDLEHWNEKPVPVVMAPYLSEQARAACREEGVGYADFQGNVHIAFDAVYIDRQVASRPEPERRALRSLFKPKSARILRSLLREPGRGWRVAELAETAQVSIGLVSTIGSALRERGWVEQREQGLVLSNPDDLLDTWAEQYEQPKGEEIRLYTHLHGAPLAERLRNLQLEGGCAVLSSFSAAEWLAPYVRQANTFLYANETGLTALQQGLDLKPAAKGQNFIIRVPDEDGVLDDAVPVANGLYATSPVQTYLDLMQAGERGREGAEHLRAILMKWNP